MPQTPNAEDEMEGQVGPNRNRMPIDRQGQTCKVEIYDETTGTVQEGYITANTKDGQLGEIFLQGFGKEGSTLEGWVQFSAILFSTALQYGAEFSMLARKIAHMKFPPYGPTNHLKIPYCRSVPDFIVHWLVLHYGDDTLKEDLKKIDAQLRKSDGRTV